MKAGAGIAPALLRWYDRERRDLPWRRAGTDAYRTLVSELMLQQTGVATVIPYFERFVARWPSVAALAAAPVDDVLAAWSGLGYYARARNLHRAACAVVDRHGGVVPDAEAALRTLPGVGAYTAAAVAAIAFGRRTFALDGNAARVVARMAAVADPIDRPATRVRLRAIGEGWVPARRAGDFAQAVMDLGATVCTVHVPGCERCPVASACVAQRTGRADDLPRRGARAPKLLVRVGCARVRRGGKVLLVRRREGLLAGTWSLPLQAVAGGAADGDASAVAAAAAARALGIGVGRAVEAGSVRHVFTHRDMTAEVFDLEARGGGGAAVAAHAGDGGAGVETLWADETDLGGLAVSTFLRKLLAVPRASTPSSRRKQDKGGE